MSERVGFPARSVRVVLADETEHAALLVDEKTLAVDVPEDRLPAGNYLILLDADDHDEAPVRVLWIEDVVGSRFSGSLVRVRPKR